MDKISGLDGFNIAVTKDFTLIDRALYIQTGLGYTYQNDSKNTEKSGVRIIGDANAAYSYNYFSGKVKTNDKMSAEIVEWMSGQLPDAKYRRVDMQLGCSAGVRFLNFIEAEIGYDHDLRLRRQQFYLSVGLRF